MTTTTTTTLLMTESAFSGAPGDSEPLPPVQAGSRVGAAQDGGLVAQGARCPRAGRATRPWARRATRQRPARGRAGRSRIATAATRRDHVRPVITAGQQPRPDF